MPGTERHDSASDDLSAQIAQVGGIFEGTDRYLRRTFAQGSVHNGWRQFLQETGPPSAAGTACAISSLVAMGVGPRDPQLVAARDFLFSAVCPDGGWSKPRLAEHFSLTMVTCLSLLALAAMGISSEHKVLLSGLDWVVAAQNTDGGWGNTSRDGQSDTTSTSYAIRALTVDADARLRFGSVVEAGADWIDQQRDDGAWGARAGTAPTVAHTSHGTAALIAAGRPLDSLHASRTWLLARVSAEPLAAWLEHYYGSPRDRTTSADHLSEGTQPSVNAIVMRSERLRWTHLPAERTLIALLSLGVDPSHEAVGRVAQDIVGRHHDNAYWRLDSMPGTAPSWAVMEAVDALARYRRRLEEVGELFSLKKTNAQLVTEIAELRVGNTALLAAVEKLNARLSVLESAGDGPGVPAAQGPASFKAAEER